MTRCSFAKKGASCTLICNSYIQSYTCTPTTLFDTLSYNTQPPQPQFFNTNRHTAHTLQSQDSFTPLWISYSQSLCSCCLLTAWKCVPLLDLLLCARRNGLPPTPDTSAFWMQLLPAPRLPFSFHMGCSYARNCITSGKKKIIVMNEWMNESHKCACLCPIF